MSRGYLISFEGQDGCGKTTLINEVAYLLESSGYQVHPVDEFSTSHFGEYIIDTLLGDKFLRVKRGNKTSLTQVFAILADFMYLTEYEIVPHLENGGIVLKDRFIDTQIACQLPTLLEEYEMDEEETYMWFKDLLRITPVIPDLTFYIDVPLDVRIERIRRRDRKVREHRSHEVSEEDIRVFNERERIYKRLALEYPNRILVFNNNRPLDNAVTEIAETINELVNG